MAGMTWTSVMLGGVILPIEGVTCTYMVESGCVYAQCMGNLHICEVVGLCSHPGQGYLAHL